MTQAVGQRPDTQDMVIVHRVFRREFGLIPAMVRAVGAGDVPRAAAVGAHVRELCGMLHHHHTGEDELVWPKLATRATIDDDLLVRMEQQHAEVEGLLNELDGLVPAWERAADTPTGERIASVVEQLHAALVAHLDEEEKRILPLCAEHMTAQEWGEIGQRGMAGMDKSRLLVVLGHILEDASPEERKGFLSHVPPPARLAYKVVGRRKFEREVAGLRQGIRVPQQRRG